MRANDLKLTQNSYYAASANEKPAYPTLAGEISADVCVVGGGFAGLSSAIELADRGYKVVVLEANQIGFGASGRNGGQLIAGLACEQTVIENALGLQAAKTVWGMTLEALDLVRERVKRFEIDCDLSDGFLGVSVSANKGKALREWYDSMAKKYGYDAQTTWIEPAYIKQWIDSPRYFNGYYDKTGGHLHPLNYCLGLAKGAASLGVQIFQQSAVTSLQQGDTNRLQTAAGVVNAPYVVLAGNMYLPEVSPKLASQLGKRIMPVGTYIIGTEPIEPRLASKLMPKNAAVCDTNFVLDYFRLSGKRPHEGPAHDLWRTRELQCHDAAAFDRKNASPHGGDFSSIKKYQSGLHLGRLCRYHHESRARFRTICAECVLSARLFRARRGLDRFGR